jgi:acetyl esterase/lipase
VRSDYDRAVSLDPDVAAHLQTLEAASVAIPGDADLAEMRREYDEAAPALFGPAPEVASVGDEDADGVPVRVFRPTGDERGGLVYLHGGGWVLGGLQSHDPLCRSLAARSGAAVVAVDYRLAPEHRYPAAVEDAWTATRWASRRFAPLAVGGDSAGGNLAAAVALRARDAQLPLALQVLVYPATDHGCSWPSYRDNEQGPAFHTAEMRWFWEQYLDAPERAGEPDCCPLRAPDLSGVAAALVVTAEYDPLRDEGEAYARALREAGVTAELHRYDGLIHGFLRMPAVIGRAEDALTLVAGAVRDALSRP